jgi:hypothetical protein
LLPPTYKYSRERGDFAIGPVIPKSTTNISRSYVVGFFREPHAVLDQNHPGMDLDSVSYPMNLPEINDSTGTYPDISIFP